MFTLHAQNAICMEYEATKMKKEKRNTKTNRKQKRRKIGKKIPNQQQYVQ